MDSTSQFQGLGSMIEKPSEGELRRRIERDISHFGGALPERTALAWSGYLAGLIEWGLLSVSEHRALSLLLPAIDNNPSVEILLGRNDD